MIFRGNWLDNEATPYAEPFCEPLPGISFIEKRDKYREGDYQAMNKLLTW